MVAKFPHDGKPVVMQQRIKLLREKHSQVEEGRSFFALDFVEEIPSFMTNLCAGIIADSFGNADLVSGSGVVVCRQAGAMIWRSHQLRQPGIENLHQESPRGRHVPANGRKAGFNIFSRIQVRKRVTCKQNATESRIEIEAAHVATHQRKPRIRRRSPTFGDGQRLSQASSPQVLGPFLAIGIARRPVPHANSSTGAPTSTACDR